MSQPNVDWRELSVATPPQANWRFYFGGKQERNAYFQFYLENPPNRFQRWMMSKVLGIHWEKVDV